MNRKDTAAAIVEDLLTDMNGRRGFRQNWDQIDDEIKDEILTAWREIVADHLKQEDALK